MLNKRGYVLVYAIGVITLLIVLAASLTNITMTRSLWASKNTVKIKEVSKAKMQVEAAASDLSNYFNGYINIYNKYLYELDDEFQIVFEDVEAEYGVTIIDVTKNACLTNPELPYCTDKSYTYEYEIDYQEGMYLAQKRFFLSMIPSFLYFSLGSNSDMTINGGAYVSGDMYVKNNLYLTDGANYVLNSELLKHNSTFMTSNSLSNLYLQNNLYSCTNSLLTPCYSVSSDPSLFIRNSDIYGTNYFTNITSEDYDNTFVGTSPIRKQYSDRFLDVNFDSSFIYYIGDAISDKNRVVDLTNLDTEFQTYLDEGRLVEVSDLSDVLNASGDSSLIFRKSELKPQLLIDQSVSLNKEKWIIVDGDLTIDYKGYPAINVNANFLVTGNVTLSGNITLNSTIYALGKGLIHDASINNSDENSKNQLVLLTKDSLQFSKINQFDNNFSNRFTIDPLTKLPIITPDIRGYFYTERNANIYTAASYLAIKGGIFTNDGISNSGGSIDYIDDTNAVGLVINSYRGAVTEDSVTGSFIFQDPMNYTQSRFVIEHDSSILMDQPKGLPLNEQINFIFEDVTVKLGD